MPRYGSLAALVVMASLLPGAAGRAGLVSGQGAHTRGVAGANAGQSVAHSSLGDGKSSDYARDLAALGPRVTGSAAYQRAAEWCAARLRAMGIPSVAFEPFTIERGWERVSAHARILAPSERSLHVESLGWTPSTPDGGIDAEVVALDTFSPAVIARQRSLRGRIALLPDGDPPGSDAARSALALGTALRAAGALAILVVDTDPDNQLIARGFATGTSIAALPAGQVGHDDAEMIRRHLDHGPVRLSLELLNRISPGAAIVNNVIADLRGTDLADEWIVVGAHLDSWDFGSGAQDNATGVAMVLEAARAISAIERPPRRSIRFALWGGEEQGQLGSTAYTRTHPGDLDRTVAALNTDAGTGRTIGWTAPGRSDVVRGVGRLMQNTLDELGAGIFDESLRYAFQSDGAPFVLAGVPMLDLNADDTRYEEIHHKAADTFDRVDVRRLATGAAVVAATAYAIADAASPIAGHLDRRAVERLRKRGAM
jgi:carboxypeptidase Q